MKRLLAFLLLAVALAAAPTTPINNANIQLNGVSQTGVLAGQSTGAATATGAQISTAIDLLGSTRGGLLYRGATGWSLLAPGTSGFVLTSAGAGADPVWSVNAGGDVVGPASSTLNAWPLFADTTGKLLKNSDVTYSTPTLSVPDAFVVSSAGSIGLTAAVNRNISLNTSGTGLVLGVKTEGISGSIQITYTGTPQTPLIIPTSSSVLVVPVASASGTNTYTSIAGVSSGSFNYSESNATTGNHITALTFDNLVSIDGAFAPINVPNITLLSTPLLTTVAGNFNPNGMASLTTLTITNLTNVGGSFNASSMAALTTLSAPSLAYVGNSFVPC